MSHLPQLPHTPDTPDTSALPTTPADSTPALGAGLVIAAAPSAAAEPVADSSVASDAAVTVHPDSKLPMAPELSSAELGGTDDHPSTAASAHADLSVATPADAAEADSPVESVADGDADVAVTAAAGPAGNTPALPRVPDLGPAACAELLRQHFPALFTGPPKPLKLRIQQDIQQRTPGVFSKGSLGAFFRRYTGSTGYLMALGKASQRFDLDGQPAGELSEEHRALAREELARRRQLGRDRDQVVQAQQQAAQAQQLAAQAELLQARQARLGLLRDFERTTLTLANFCALKGLTPETLTPQLEQAKREAAESPPARPVDDRRGPPGPRRDDRNGPRPEGRRDGRPSRAPGPDSRGDPRSDPRSEASDQARVDNRGDGRPDPRPQPPRPPGRPGGRPGGPGGRSGGR